MKMKNKYIAIVGSNHSTSINKQLTESVLKNYPDIELIDIQNLQVPIYSQDLEAKDGIPQEIQDLVEKMKESQKLVMVTNEHNSAVSVFFKNILDWISRHDRTVYQDKDVLVMSTSMGKRGGLSANEYLSMVIGRSGVSSVDSIVFPSFGENFDTSTSTIINQELKQMIEDKFDVFLSK